jgi:Ca2+-binding RTX toxin-like protein/arylsulfatase A-like enzyme
MPNILMIAVDDLNAWATVLGSYAAPVDTPNLDRLRAAGVNFTNANAAVPLCNPARTAVLTGMSPLSSGVFDNTQDMFDHVSPQQTLPALLRQAGYETVLAGKVFHKLTDAQAAGLYDRVFSTMSTGAEFDPHLRDPMATQAPAGVYTGDPALLSDSRNVAFALDVLAGHQPKPGAAGLFLSVGLTSTHLPWSVPKAYFDRFPLDAIVLPEAPPNDLDDLPDFALQFIDPDKFGRVLGVGEWKKLVQAYLATMAFMDELVGRLLDGLAASSIAGDTMVVFWSDHGFHLGDKEMITTKLSLWEPATRAPLIIADPGAAGRGGTDVAQIVSTVDLFPTMLDYAGVAVPRWADGQSLLKLIRTGDASGLSGAAVTLIDGNFSLRTEQFRYTRYEDGSAELYDMAADPRQFTNLAGDPAHAGVQAALSAQLDAWLGQFNLHQNRGGAAQLLQGGAERDILIAGFAPDTLVGGGGDDVYLLRDGAETVMEAAGGGKDTVILEAAQRPYRLPDHVENLQLGRAGYNPREPAVHVLYGNALDNVINAFVRAPVWIEAGAGNDKVLALLTGRATGVAATATILGGEGNDNITSGANGDRLFGEAGNDTLQGGVSGDDSLVGGPGDDYLFAARGADTLDGGDGDDTMIGGEGGDTYIASAGQDTITETGTTGFDILDVTRWGLRGFTLTEQRGADGRIEAFLYTARDGSGTTTVLAQEGRNPIEALRDGGVIWLVNGHVFVAGGGDDHVVGTALGDRLSGGDGDDVLLGEGGPDLLDGGRGADTLRGGAGDDALTGGPGLDHFLVDAGTDGITDLGLGGAEVVVVSAGAAVVARLGANWTAGAATANAGAATLLAQGFSASLAAASGPQGWLLSNAGGARGVTLTGSPARDTLTGGEQADALHGGRGDDLLQGGGGNDTLTGGPGDDTLTGGAGLDRFLVDAGTDRITDLGLGGAEVVMVSAGAAVSASLAAAWTAGAGTANSGSATVLAQGFGVDLGAAGGALGWLVSNAAGARGATLKGSMRNDTLLGGAGADTLVGGAGNDTLRGGGGVDSFVVDSGRDLVADLGAGGFDVLTVHAGATAQAVLAGAWMAPASGRNDGTVNLDAAGFNVNLAAATGTGSWSVTNAAPGPVALIGSARGDQLAGGAGDDTIHGREGADTLVGGAGNDVLVGGAGDDVMTGGAGLDRFVVDAGTDRITDLGLGGAEVVMVSAGATLVASLAAPWVAGAGTANAGGASVLAQGHGVDLGAAGGPLGWLVSNAASARGAALTGSLRGDTLIGGAGADVLRGGAGDDMLSGGAWNDELWGGAGNDVMTGGAGADRFHVDAGADRITDLGFGGADTLIVWAGASVTATLAAGWAAPRLTANSGVANILANGHDANLAQATGSQGWNVSNAGSATGVVLTGSALADRLTGGSGADTLIGGLGADVLAGGAGADVFRFTSAAAADGDVILDFNAAQGDVIDLSPIDANGARPGNAAFAFLGAGAFTGVAGQLRFAGGQLLGDLDGDRAADFAITLVGVVTLEAGHIWL